MKTCTKCNLSKEDRYFPKQSSSVCNVCKAERLVDRMQRHMEMDGLSINVFENKDEVNVLPKYLTHGFKLEIDKAREVMEKVDFKIIDENTIYLMDFLNPEKEDMVTRIEVFERDDYICQYCGGEGDSLDHVFPESKGGAFVANNLVVSCKSCNSIKGNTVMTTEEARKRIKRLKRIQKKRKSEKNKEKNKISDPNSRSKDNLHRMLNSALRKKEKWQ
jgi:hypothetical protein